MTDSAYPTWKAGAPPRTLPDDYEIEFNFDVPDKRPHLLQEQGNEILSSRVTRRNGLPAVRSVSSIEIEQLDSEHAAERSRANIKRLRDREMERQDLERRKGEANKLLPKTDDDFGIEQLTEAERLELEELHGTSGFSSHGDLTEI